MRKGQISIEYLLIISLMLLYITVIILPNVDLSAKTAKEIAGISQARLAAEKILSTANEVALSGEKTRQTIRVYVPARTFIDCNITSVGMPATISFDYNLSLGIPVYACDERDGGNEMPEGTECSKDFNTVSGFNFTCTLGSFPIWGDEKGKITGVKVEKNDAEVTITGNIET
ncbi:MAG: hypothetical protein HY392_04195 [Candidatus Diapherotrites archaeon]|nr:hypothetical protein [Candidatus Diapherotrites archaeon]